MQNAYIYALVDPLTGLTRYIGKSNNPQSRFKGHLRAKKENHPRDRWIRSLKAIGLEPELVVLEGPCKDWREAERRWVACLRPQLTNIAPGGESFDLADFSPAEYEAFCAYRRAAIQRFWDDPERSAKARNKVTQSNKDWHATRSDEERKAHTEKRLKGYQEFLANLSLEEYEAHFAKFNFWANLSPEEYEAVCTNMSQSRKEWWASLSPEERETLRENISKRRKEWWVNLSPEEREAHLVESGKKISITKKGNVVISPEQRAKAKVNGERFWAKLDREERAKRTAGLRSAEARAKSAAARKGRKDTTETRAKKSASAKGKPKPRVKCPYCDLECACQVLSRHIAARHSGVTLG